MLKLASLSRALGLDCPALSRSVAKSAVDPRRMAPQLVIFFMTSQAFVKARLPGKACTAVQLLTVLAVLLWPDMPTWLYYLPDVLWWTSLALAVIATLDYVRAGGQFLNPQDAVRQA